MKMKPVHIIAGPTASGKSALALELARQCDGVIINCDSLQIYDGLPLLTAQPAPEDFLAVPHRLYGHLHPDEATSAGHWREMVMPLIEDIIGQGRTPIVCGGTGLYIKALMEGLSPMPDVPPLVRAQVVERYEILGAQGFHDELAARDPVMAARFHVNHKARILRAMEVLEATGHSLAHWQALERTAPPADWDFHVRVVMPARDDLYARCNLRFEMMMAAGALEEVQAFSLRLERGEISETAPLVRALGFRPLRAALRGEMDLAEAITQAQADTRHYAKRQSTWFRNQM